MGAAAADPAALEGLRLAALAERIAKLHAQAAHQGAPPRSSRALADTVRELEAALAAAARGAPAERRDHHTLLALLWQEYRPWALRTPTADTARKVADRADEMAWVLAKPARELRGEPAAALQALRAAMLSQRLARLHLMRRRDELPAPSSELDAIVRELAAHPGNTPQIAAELQVAQTQHAFLARAAAELQRSGTAAPHLANIAKTADHIRESMERAARLYAAANL